MVSQTVSEAYKLHESAEAQEEVDGVWKATGTLLVYERDGRLHHARSSMTFKDYRHPSQVLVDTIVDEKMIPKGAYCLQLSPEYTVADTAGHVKRPRLLSYDISDYSIQLMQHEITICEQLHKIPHPNLLRYLGCEVKDGMVTGLCFEEHKETLMQRVNPRASGKRAFEGFWNESQISQCLDPIESALRHLHSHGIIHNDVNPANIMFSSENEPVLIDFGSCCLLGESLVDIQNDLNALQEIREWLSEKKNKTWLFKE